MAGRKQKKGSKVKRLIYKWCQTRGRKCCTSIKTDKLIKQNKMQLYAIYQRTFKTLGHQKFSKKDILEKNLPKDSYRKIRQNRL